MPALSTKLRTIVIAYSIIFTTFLIGCNSNHTHTATEKKYKLALHPQTGTKYYYTINNETDINLTVKDNKINNQNNTTIGLIYEINNDSAGNIVFKITYDSFHVAMKKDDKTTTFDASNGEYSLDPVEKMLAVLKGNSIFFTLNKEGKTIAVTGYKEIADKLVTQMQIEDETERQQIQARLSDMAGEGFLKNNLEQTFNIFPDSALYIGDTWVKTLTASTELGLDLSTNYKLSSVDDNIATIESNSGINMSNQNINVMSAPAKASLKGSEDGKLQLDIYTGIITQAESKVSIKGNIETMDMQVPMTIKIVKRIKTRKLD